MKSMFNKGCSALIIVIALCFMTLLTASGISENSGKNSNDLSELEILNPNEYQYVELTRADKPEIISEAQVRENGHVVRLREQETDLSTICFQNRDGTKSVYFYGDPVKYIDSRGNIRDKSNVIHEITGEATQKYAYVSDENDINTYFPKELSKDTSIVVDSGDYQIKLYPVYITDNFPVANKVVDTELSERNYIYYDDAFGRSTSLRYTPTFEGVKEDIILYEDVGANKFDFILQTNGLKADVCNGQIVLTDQSGIPIGSLSEIVVYDSAVSINYFLDNIYDLTPLGTDGDYALSIIIDSEYIRDAKTVFPVFIDPTVYLYTSDGIQSAPIYSFTPTTAYPTASLFNVGYSSSYGVGRSLYRFPAFYQNSLYKSLSASQITEFKFVIYETSNTSTVATIRVHLYNGPSWTDTSATFNNTSSGAYGIMLDSKSVGNTAGTFYGFDIKAAAVQWNAGTADPIKGIVMINANESSSSHAKQFVSTRNGPNQPYLMLKYT